MYQAYNIAYTPESNIIPRPYVNFLDDSNGIKYVSLGGKAKAKPFKKSRTFKKSRKVGKTGKKKATPKKSFKH